MVEVMPITIRLSRFKSTSSIRTLPQIVSGNSTIPKAIHSIILGIFLSQLVHATEEAAKGEPASELSKLKKSEKSANLQFNRCVIPAFDDRRLDTDRRTGHLAREDRRGSRSVCEFGPPSGAIDPEIVCPHDGRRSPGAGFGAGCFFQGIPSALGF